MSAATKTLLFITIVLINACAIQPNKNDFIEGQYWQIRGKLAYKTAQESGSANFTWRQSGQQYRLDLQGPLGSFRREISGNLNSNIAVVDNGSQQQQINTSEFSATTGIPIKLKHLPYWIRGQLAPQAAPTQVERNTAGQISQFSQDHWTIHYLSYQHFDQQQLPRKIRIKSDTQPPHQLTIIIKQWQAL